MSSDSAVDFWITDSDGYNDWKDDKTPPTAKMFKSTYCSDCTAFGTTFVLPSSNEKYYYIVSAMNPSVTADGKVEFYYDGSGDYSDAEEEEDSNGCFSADSLVQFKNGSSLPLKDARVGDEILAASYSGEISYSPVIHLPHKVNDDRGKMVRVTTTDASSLVMTKNHLIMTCEASREFEGDMDCSHCMSSPQPTTSGLKDEVLASLSDDMRRLSPFSLRRADEIRANSTCLLTSTASVNTQWTLVSEVTSASTAGSGRKGLYTIVTQAPYPIVDNVVVSPFSTSHVYPHTFYHIHRIIYTLGLSENKVVMNALELLTTCMHDMLNMPRVLALSDNLMSVASSIHNSIFVSA